MTIRRLTSTFLAAATAVTTVAVPALPAGAVEGAPGVRPGGFRIEAAEGTTLTIPGLGRFTDTIEVIPAPDGGLQVVNELDLDAYVEGLGEMPAAWHEEALKAQAVAARTYAWSSERRGYYLEQGLDFDICGTTACQVFKGRAIVETPGVGPRWAAAVAATEGEVLAYEDRPILARFFSTSGGATRANEDVFPGSGPRPYLKAVEDPDDAVSPLSRWDVTFSREMFNEILSRGETLSAAVPVKAVRRDLADGTRTDEIVLTREDGHEVRISASKFRAWVSDLAPELYPGRFPARRADGGPMPTTLPSSRLEFELTPANVIVHGYGWGHGVGMSQYGAKGKAERGVAYDDILATYYGGLRPEAHERVPERIRVGLTWDATQVQVQADGYVRVLTDTAETDARSTIPWVFRAGGAAKVDLVQRPHSTFVERTTPSRRLPRIAPLPDEPAATGEGVEPNAEGAPPAAAPAPDGDVDAPAASTPEAGRSFASVVGDSLSITVPGVGLMRLLSGALRSLGD